MQWTTAYVSPRCTKIKLRRIALCFHDGQFEQERITFSIALSIKTTSIHDTQSPSKRICTSGRVHDQAQNTRTSDSLSGQCRDVPVWVEATRAFQRFRFRSSGFAFHVSHNTVVDRAELLVLRTIDATMDPIHPLPDTQASAEMMDNGKQQWHLDLCTVRRICGDKFRSTTAASSATNTFGSSSDKPTRGPIPPASRMVYLIS